MFNIDTFIKGGANHNMCEDYILSGLLPRPYIIISDGCSSSDNTETGARILCHLAKQYIKYRADYLDDLNKEEMGDWIAHNAEMTARQLGLPTSCLDATLIVALKEETRINIIFYGDGFVYAVAKDSIFDGVLDEVSYTNNAPYYLSYRIDPARNELYHEMGNSVNLVTKYKGDDLPPDENFEVNYAYDQVLSVTFPLREIKSLFISSDGLGSFIIPDPAGQIKMDPMQLMFDHFSKLKNTTGDFLKRRCNKAIKHFERDGIIHFDDFSMGAFLLED